MNDTSIVLKKCKLSARVFSLRLYARHLYKYYNGNKQKKYHKSFLFYLLYFCFVLYRIYPWKACAKKTTYVSSRKEISEDYIIFLLYI